MASAIATQGNRRQPAYCSTQKWRRPAGSHKETATNQRRPQSAQPTKSLDMTDKEETAKQRPHTATEIRSSTTWVDKKTEIKESENSLLEAEDTFLKDTFLDSEYSIRKDIHEKLRSFSWLNGGYGVEGPNKKIPRPHIYVTVKRGYKKSEALKEIETIFECDPKKYFELLRETRKKPKFKCLSKPKSGGNILAVSNDNEPNPLQPVSENDINDKESWITRASGTLAMFCYKNHKHYALTCFHVACSVTDEQCFNQTFNHPPEKFLTIRNSIEGYENFARERLQFFYRPQENENKDENQDGGNYICLGEVSKCCFDSESDFMSIKVPEEIEINCQLEQIDSPIWPRIWTELYNRNILRDENSNPVRVEKHGFPPNPEHKGHIFKICHTHVSKKETLFQDAIVIKGNSDTFLRDGDSGALIYFLDENDKKQAFAYGVFEVDQLGQEETSSDEDSENSNENSSENNSGNGSEHEDSSGRDSSSSNTNVEEYVGTGKECERKDRDDGDSDSDESVQFREEDDNGPFAICLKLNTALNHLELSDAGCFRQCNNI